MKSAIAILFAAIAEFRRVPKETQKSFKQESYHDLVGLWNAVMAKGDNSIPAILQAGLANADATDAYINSGRFYSLEDIQYASCMRIIEEGNIIASVAKTNPAGNEKELLAKIAKLEKEVEKWKGKADVLLNQVEDLEMKVNALTATPEPKAPEDGSKEQPATNKTAAKKTAAKKTVTKKKGDK